MIYSRALTEDETKALADPRLDMAAMLIYKHDDSALVESDTLFFNDDVFMLNAAQRMKLQAFVKYLQIGNQYYLEIKGHTNGLPPEDFCDALSLKRAKVVEDYLRELGISCHKITPKAIGKREQIAPNTNPESRKRNQRAELLLYKANRA